MGAQDTEGKEIAAPPARRDGYVQANGLSIYYEECGQKEPFILIHGAGWPGMWDPWLPAFAAHFRVIAPHSRGQGKTNNPSGKLSYRLMADDMAAFSQALGLERPLVCGISDGGQIALELGMRYSALVRAIVIGAAWFGFPDGYRRKLQDWGFPAPGVVDFDNPVVQGGDLYAPEGPEQRRAALIEMGRMFWTPLDYTAEDFSRVQVPALVLIGDRDPTMPVESAVEMYRMIPGAELAVMPGAAHGSVLDRPELLTALILDFLLRQSPSAAVEPAAR